MTDTPAVRVIPIMHGTDYSVIPGPYQVDHACTIRLWCKGENGDAAAPVGWTSGDANDSGNFYPFWVIDLGAGVPDEHRYEYACEGCITDLESIGKAVAACQSH